MAKETKSFTKLTWREISESVQNVHMTCFSPMKQFFSIDFVSNWSTMVLYIYISQVTIWVVELLRYMHNGVL